MDRVKLDDREDHHHHQDHQDRSDYTEAFMCILRWVTLNADYLEYTIAWMKDGSHISIDWFSKVCRKAERYLKKNYSEHFIRLNSYIEWPSLPKNGVCRQCEQAGKFDGNTGLVYPGTCDNPNCRIKNFKIRQRKNGSTLVCIYCIKGIFRTRDIFATPHHCPGSDKRRTELKHLYW